jgi:hypothetical protein
LAHKVCLIQLHMGPLPSWFPYFLATAGTNQEYHWLIVTNQPIHWPFPENCKTITFSKEQLAKIVEKKLEVRISLNDPRKPCDLKPAFGFLFEMELKVYEWWGYTDNDLVMGQLNNFLLPEYFQKYDLISTYPCYLSGPLCLYRNTDKMNSLFQSLPRYKEILGAEKCMGIDENLVGHPVGKKLADFLALPLFVLNPRNYQGPFPAGWKELRHQYYWQMKKRQVGEPGIHDMTDLVHDQTRKGEIKPLFSNLLISDAFFDRLGKKHWKMSWKEGVLREECSGKEVFAFHFRELKHQSSFIVEEWKHDMASFELDKHGIRRK